MYIVLKTYQTFILITLSIHYILMHRFNMYSFVRLIIIYIINRMEHSVAIPPRHPILVLLVLLLRFNIFRHEISQIF